MTPRRSARWLRWVAGAFVGLLVVGALLITALRIAIAYLPEHAGTLRAWVEQQTHMRFEYSRLDARLRWYGPEVVLQGVKVIAEDGSQALFTAREASVGLDLWNLFRTGQLVAGRVYLDRPRVTIVRLADGRFRLLGLGERPADRPPFDLDRLPAGRVVVENAAVLYRDLMTGRPPLELDDLAGELRRDRDFVRMEGQAQLPQSLGSRAEFDVRLKGSLDERDQLDARVELRSDSLRLAGLQQFIPGRFARPQSGRGPVRAVVAVQHGRLSIVRLELGLRNVTLNLPERHPSSVEAMQVTNPRLELSPGTFMRHPTVTKTEFERSAAPLPTQARFDVLSGSVRLRREGEAWTFRVENFIAQPAGRERATAATRVAGRWWGRAVSRFGLDLEVDHADLERLWPLALAFAPASFDRWAGLAPTGRIESLRAQATRERAGLTPAFNVKGRVDALGIAATGRLPGASGLTATFAGSSERGTLELRSRDATFEWPRIFAAPLQLVRAEADLAWRKEGETWIFSTRGARLEHAQARATVTAELRFIKPTVSPELQLEADVEQADVAAVPLFIPYGRLHERTIAWLDRAFIRGQVADGHLSYRGPVRKFPFRNGEGEFIATARARDVTLDYYPGFAPLTGASGTVEFHNASIRAQLDSGDIAGVRLGATSFVMGDYKMPVLDIDAQASGDLRKALAYVQSSPLGPRIGEVFMGLKGSGPARYQVKLLLPAMSDETRRELGDQVPERDYFVRATLDGATVTLPALRAPAQRVVGTFELHNDQITVPALRGTILDGPFELQASPGRPSKDVLAAIDLTGKGRAGGAKLPAFIGLPSTIRMTGTADWELRGRIEKRGEGQWPLTFDVASNLSGLQVDAPKPFAKAPAEVRPTRVRIELPGQRVDDVTIESGSARAKLRFADRNGQWRLERGSARFDGQPAVLTSQPGLLVTGDWPQFDLGEWLALGETPAPTNGAAAPAQKLMDWLGPVDVHLDRATVFGFQFQDVVAKLRGEGDTWRVGVSGPGAEGQVTVPDDFSRGRPIVLDMKRLHLASVEPTGKPNGTEPATDPRKLPAMTVHADDFVWQGRKFGRLNAVITRDARGLRFDTLNTVSSSFDITGKGSWLVETGGVRTRLEAQLSSTDFGAATAALGYRDVVDAKKARIDANLWWPGGPSGDAIAVLNGTLRLVLENGQMRDIEPGAGRMLGLLSVTQLPRRLALDFRDVTDKGLAFNSVKGDFDVRSGNAYTQNLLLKGPAVNIGIVGRTGLAAEDYDQTVVVSGNTSGPLAVAGALAAGPVVGAGVLVLSQLFKDQLQGLTRIYYHVGGPWSAPVVQRVSAPGNEDRVSADTSERKEGANPP